MSRDLSAVAEYAVFDETEKKLLSGPERPIVLLRKREGNQVAPLVAPSNGYFGVMMPYTLLHHLLLRDNFTALVMTSGNLSMNRSPTRTKRSWSACWILPISF